MSGKVIWSVPLGAKIQATTSPVVGPDGDIYFGAQGPAVHCFSRTGKRRWTFKPKSNSYPLTHSVFSTPAVGQNGLLYFGGMEGGAYAVNATSGKLIWRFEVPNSPSVMPPAILRDGTVLFALGPGLLGMEGKSGKQLWSLPVPEAIASSPALTADDVMIFACENTLYAVDIRTRRIRWTFVGTGNFFTVTPALSDQGLVVIGNDKGLVYGIESSSGKERWSFQTGGRVESSAALGRDGTVYVGSFDGRLYALDGATGRKKWDFLTGKVGDPSRVPAWVRSSPAVTADGVVYFGSMNGSFYAVRGRDGGRLWEIQTGMGLSESPAVGADGTVYFANDRLFAVR